MSLQIPFRVKQSTTTTGTGPLTLLAPAGQQRSYQQHYGSGPVKVPYWIAGQGYYEGGFGTFTGPNGLTRDFVLLSSNSNSLVSLPTATADVFADWPSASRGFDSHSGSVAQSYADANNVVEFTATATFTLHAIADLPASFDNIIWANGGDVTLTPSSGTINGASSVVVKDGSSGLLHQGDSEWKFIVFSAPPPAGPVVLASGSISGSSQTFDLSSYTAYARFNIQIDEVIPSSNPDYLVTYSTDGGSTFLTSGYSWGNAQLGDTYVGAHLLSTTAIKLIAGASIHWGPIDLVLTGINQAKQAYIRSFMGGDAFAGQLAGGLNATTNINAIKLAVSTGTFTGTYRIIGYP